MLEVDDYAYNLKIYFGRISPVKTISLENFSIILTGLTAAENLNAKKREKKKQQNDTRREV